MFLNAGTLSKPRYYSLSRCRFVSYIQYDVQRSRSRTVSRSQPTAIQESSRLFCQQKQSFKLSQFSLLGIHTQSTATVLRGHAVSYEYQYHLNCQLVKPSLFFIPTNVIDLDLVRARQEWRRQDSRASYSTVCYKSLLTILASIGTVWALKDLVADRKHLFEKVFPRASCTSNVADKGLSTDSHREDSVFQNITKQTDSVVTGFPHGRPEQKKMGADKNEHGRISLKTAVAKAQELCQRRKDEVGSPGLVVCVSVDGKQIYAEGFGYADLENRIPMMPCSVLRIASISKAITATIVAKAFEKGQIDIERKIQSYVPSFPEKEFMGEKVEITVRQLLNHTSGIRHYKAKDDPVSAFDKTISDLVEKGKKPMDNLFFTTGPRHVVKEGKTTEGEKKDKKKEVSELEREEYYLTRNFPTTKDSMQIFANDCLVAKPGTKFVYTTFGYTLLAAAVESVLKKPFTDLMIRTLRHMGLKETYLDQNDPIIYNRARYYVKNEQGCVVNAPYVDLSYKWAGGGLLSTAEDIVKFGNVLLYSSQHSDKDPGLPGFLKSSTVWKFWDPQRKKGELHMYGLGFELTPAKDHYGMCEHHSFGAGHTGAAVGASSALFILPRRDMTMKSSADRASNSTDFRNGLNRNPASEQTDQKSVKFLRSPSAQVKTNSTELGTQDSKTVVRDSESQDLNPGESGPRSELPQGVVVAIFVNMISVSVRDTAEKIARIFEDVDPSL